MNFLLDTNVVSESTKPQPNQGLVAWLADVDEDRTFLSVMTLAELRYGLERLSAGRKRNRLEEWLEHDLKIRFEDRILGVNAEVADVSGKLVAESESMGRPMETRDALIAATSKTYELTLVTRNTRDFEAIIKTILNPWS